MWKVFWCVIFELYLYMFLAILKYCTNLLFSVHSDVFESLEPFFDNKTHGSKLTWIYLKWSDHSVDYSCRQLVLVSWRQGPSLFVPLCVWEWEDPEVCGKAPAFLYLLCKTCGCAVFTFLSWGAPRVPQSHIDILTVMYSYWMWLQHCVVCMSTCSNHLVHYEWNVHLWLGYVSLLCDLNLAEVRIVLPCNDAFAVIQFPVTFLPVMTKF